jgi:putative peptidoglycan lipid II flippase
VIVASFSVLSRFVGFIRDRILAGMFGAGDALDVYFTAFRLPDMFYQLIVVGALSASFIPLFTKFYSKDRERAFEFVNRLLHALALGFGIFVLVGIALSGPLAHVIAPGFSVEKTQMVAELSRILFLAQFILALSMVFGSMLQGLKRFVFTSAAPVFYNVGIIIGAWLFVPYFGIHGVAYGVLLGAGAHLLLQIVDAWIAGYRYRAVLSIFHKDTYTVVTRMGPRALGLAVSQLNFTIMTTLATLLGTGAVTIFQFAYNLNFFPVGIVGVSFAIAAYPELCERAEEEENVGFAKTFSATARQILLFTVPATLLFLLLRTEIVRIVLGAGVFDWTATIITANLLGFFAISLIFQSLTFLLVRGFFAFEDTVTPFYIGIASVGLNVLLAWALLFPLAPYLPGLGLHAFGIAFSASSFLQFALLWYFLRKKTGSLGGRGIFRAFTVFCVAGVGLALTTQFMKILIGTLFEINTFWLVFLRLTLGASLGLITYFIMTFALRNEETHVIILGMKKLIRRKIAPPETVVSDVS